MINAPRRHRELRSDPAKFAQMCSALDVLGDTEMALDAYLDRPPRSREHGTLYLRAYGVLQALVLQQDAVVHLADSLGIAYTAGSTLKVIREIRNNSVGHPTRRGSPPGRAFNHIVRVSLTHVGFSLLTFDAKGQMKQHSVDVPRLIADQRQAIEIALSEFITAEVSVEQAHRARYKDDQLSTTLPDWVDYSLEKLGQEIEHSLAFGQGPSLLESISGAIAVFENKLCERGELDAAPEVFECHIAPARHAIRRLAEYFQRDTEQYPSQEDASVFLAHLDTQIDALRELAEEIDETYASRAEPDVPTSTST